MWDVTYGPFAWLAIWRLSRVVTMSWRAAHRFRTPNDRPGETLAKVGDWIVAGARLVWVIDPQRRIARVYRQDGTESIIAEPDSLNGEDVLSGFTCSLSFIF